MFKLTGLGKHTQYIAYVMGKKKNKKLEKILCSACLTELGRKIGEKHIIIHLALEMKICVKLAFHFKCLQDIHFCVTTNSIIVFPTVPQIACRGQHASEILHTVIYARKKEEGKKEGHQANLHNF